MTKKPGWEFWLSLDETVEFIDALESARNDALRHISGSTGIESYAKNDGIYIGLCQALDFIEELKTMKEENKDA